MSKIESLPGVHWTPQAMLASIREDVPNMQKAFIVFVDNNGKQYRRSAGFTNQEFLYHMQHEIFVCQCDINGVKIEGA